MSKVSIVIPCYNAKETIKKTLHSIAMQSIAEDLEVLIVNDADGLNYNGIIDLASFGDLNIRYIVRENNGGCGAARNTGIREAKSDYVIFSDSDDCFTNCLSAEIMYNRIVTEKADILVSTFESEMRLADGVAIRQMKNAVTWCHGKVYRRQYLIDNNLFFNEKLRLNEDVEFHQLLFDMGAKVAEIPMVTLMWRDNPTSLTHESLYKNKRTFIDACSEYVKDCSERGLTGEKVTIRVLQNLITIYWYTNVVMDENEDKVADFMSACKEYWELIEPIVSNVDDGLTTKIYCNIAKTFDFVPSIGFIEWLNELRK